MIDEEIQRQQFATWLKQQLKQRGWKQGKLISQSGASDEERLSSAAVSRYSTGKMLPDVVSCQKIAHAFDVPLELVLRKAYPHVDSHDDSDWLQHAIDDLAHAVEAGQLSEAGRLVIIANIQRERRLRELELKEG